MASATVTREFRVGLFLLVAVVLVTGVSAKIGGFGPFAPPGQLQRVLLEDLGGLDVGDEVRVAGVDAGRVAAVEYEPEREYPVSLDMRLEPWVDLRKGATAVVASDGLLGNRFLSLDPGRGPALGAGDPVIAETPSSIEDMMGTVEGLSTSVEEAIGAAQTTMDEVKDALVPTLERIEALLAEDMLTEVRATVRQSRQLVTHADENLSRVAERFDALGASLQETNLQTQPALQELSEALDAINQVLGPNGENLRDVLRSMQRALDSADLERGELAQSLSDLEAVLGNLREITEDVRGRPSRLLGIGPRKDRKPGDP